MFKVLHEFKQSARDFDNECIYCKYSQYALRESAKVNSSNSIINGSGNGTSSFVKTNGDGSSEGVSSSTNVNNLTNNNGSEQQNSDPRIENLVRMF